MKRLAAVLIGVSLALFVGLAVTASPSTAQVSCDSTPVLFVEVIPGEQGYSALAKRLGAQGTAADATYLRRQNAGRDPMWPHDLIPYKRCRLSTSPTTTTTSTTATSTTTTTTTVAPTTTVPSGTIPDIPSTGFNRADWLTINRNTSGQLIIPKNSPESSGNFRMFCGFVKLGHYDPIVYPGQTNVGHLHQFFGNDAITGQSTYESLRSSGGAGSSCQGGPLNRTGYWAPAMFTASNQVMVPYTFSVYYKGNGTRSDIEAIETMPNELRMIAGYNMASTDTSMPYGAMAPSWQCLNGNTWTSRRLLTQFTPANCPAGSEIKAELRFPQCWDGKNLDSTNHRSHMSYALGGGGWFTQQPGGKCPTTHPVHLPEFTLFVHYRSDGDVANWYLSSDRMPGMTHANGETFHADWFGAWDNAVQETWVQECIRELRDCNFGELGDGTSLKNYSGTYTGPNRIPGYTPTP